MKTIVLGYKDEQGLGADEVILGLQATEKEKIALMNAAKFENKLPKGFSCLVQGTFNPIETAIKIKPRKESVS